MLIFVFSDYFNSLNNALEMRARTRSVNDKITYAAEVQSVLRQLLTEVSSITFCWVPHDCSQCMFQYRHPDTVWNLSSFFSLQSRLLSYVVHLTHILFTFPNTSSLVPHSWRTRTLGNGFRQAQEWRESISREGALVNYDHFKTV